MASKVLLNGIYDKRTINFIKSEGVRAFGFDFDPRSFNFIQEYIFLDIFKNQIGENDKIFLRFKSNSDYLIPKLISDLRNIQPKMDNVFFVFDEFNDASEFEFNYLIKFNLKIATNIIQSKNFKGFIFDFKDFEYYLEQDSLTKFISNIYTRFPFILNSNFISILNISWNDNLVSGLLEEIEFSFFQFNINSEIEVCYRNVDLNKLKKELNFKKNYIISV